MVRTAIRAGFALLAVLRAAPASAQSAPAPGVLIVESEPARAFVQVDSVRAGPSPVGVPVGEGLHRVLVLYAGYDPFEQTVRVRLGETVRVWAPLVRRTGTVTVEGLPAGAVV
ncbi:MAG TPA: PEGA domain-containing protein, partial [Rubricoccaceae bacterium]